MTRSLTRVVLLTGLCFVAACRKPAPDAAPAAAAGTPATIEVLKDGRWLFTYAEPSGGFATTDKPDSVPAGARAAVRVFDPSAPEKTPGDGRVYVTNLDDVMNKGKATARAMSREGFETAAMAAHPTGDSSPLAAQGMHPAPMPAAVDAGAAAGPAPAAGGAPVVTIYGTSWCGACRAARQYLTERKIPFADKDVERDADAARELAAKAAKMGVPTDRVPVIDVRGRLLLGFDKARIESLLGGAHVTRCARLLGAAVVAAALAAPASAEARLIDLRAAAQAGGMFGWGQSSAVPDFFRQSAGPGFGFELGARLLVIDLSLSFLQMIDSGGLSGTLMQALLGVEVDIPVGQPKLSTGQSVNILHAGVAGGGALGTGATVSFPINNEQVADKGLVSRFRFGYEYFLNPFMGVGGQLDLGYHYFLAGQPINGMDHASGFHIIGLGQLTFHLGY